MVASSRSPIEVKLTRLFAEVARDFDVMNMPPVRVADGLSGPLLAGIIKPVILLPSDFPQKFASKELRLILGHELAHFVRRDLIWNFQAAFVRILFFFDPMVWIAHHESRLAAESACDEKTLLQLGAEPADYAQLLLEVAAASPIHQEPRLGLSVLESYHHLKRRICSIFVRSWRV